MKPFIQLIAISLLLMGAMLVSSYAEDKPVAVQAPATAPAAPSVAAPTPTQETTLIAKPKLSAPIVDQIKEKEPDYFVIDGAPLPPRCLWYMSLDKLYERELKSISLSECLSIPKKFEKLGPLVKRGDGMIGNFITYGEGDVNERGFLFYKYLGSHSERNYLLIKTSTSRANYFSIIGDFNIKEDKLSYNGALTIPFLGKDGLQDAVFKNNTLFYNAYISPWELATLAYKSGYLKESPEKKTFNFAYRGCVGVAYMKEDQLTGFFPMKDCDSEHKLLEGKDMCYTAAINQYNNKMLSAKELPEFFQLLKTSCDTR